MPAAFYSIYNNSNKKIYVINNATETVCIMGIYSNKVLDTVKVGEDHEILFTILQTNMSILLIEREGLYLYQVLWT